MDTEDKTSESKEKAWDMKCSIDKNGTATCKITKEKFAELQQENIKAKKLIFEID